jgi:hypothetical protein
MNGSRARSVDQAWVDYRTANPAKNHPDARLAFRAGYREGINAGALLTASIVVHTTGPDTTTTTEEPT